MSTGKTKIETIKICDTKEEAIKLADEQNLDLLAGVEEIKEKPVKVFSKKQWKKASKLLNNIK